MNEQNPFDRKSIEESAAVETTGLLEQFNLPPSVIKYIRKNQRAIWFAVAGVALVVTAVSFYGSYSAYREDKASTVLALAMKAEDGKKKEELVKVAEEYGSTSAGIWARVELAHLDAEGGDFAKAVQELVKVKNDVSVKDPLAPLLLFNLAVLHEKSKAYDQALASYTELSVFKGFEAGASEAMGRIYEIQGNKEKALEMYKKYMSAGESGDAVPPGADPEREMIQARINSLES